MVCNKQPNMKEMGRGEVFFLFSQEKKTRTYIKIQKR